MLGMADMLSRTNGSVEGRLYPVLVRMADEITLLSSMLLSYQSALKSEGNFHEELVNIDDPRIGLLREAWPSFSHAAISFGYDKERRRPSFVNFALPYSIVLTTMYRHCQTPWAFS